MGEAPFRGAAEGGRGRLHRHRGLSGVGGCAAEIGAARALGSELLPLRFCRRGVHPLLKPIHGVDAIRDPEGTRERLALKLGIIDGTGGLGWPDDKSPYPGLRPFELGEHRVFFGRNIDIQKIAEELRLPANRSRSILAVVGPSGCGKSSLVRAGVLPRIAGQRDWLPLAPMVPGIDPLPRLARELAAAARRLDVDVTPLRGTSAATPSPRLPTICCWRRIWTANASCWS